MNAVNYIVTCALTLARTLQDPSCQMESLDVTLNVGAARKNAGWRGERVSVPKMRDQKDSGVGV